MPSNRRNFLKHLAAGACLFAEPYRTLAQSLRTKVKITDIKCMIVRGTWDWNLIKIETDAGISGIGEAYWGPGVSPWGSKTHFLQKTRMPWQGWPARHEHPSVPEKTSTVCMASGR